MGKKITIKEIADLSGVSAGTVDRILHNRGNVSKRAKAAVDKVLASTGYATEKYFAATAKTVSLAVLSPTSTIGDYWSEVYDGLNHAMKEFNYPGVSMEYFSYNQFDVYSCLSAQKMVIRKRPDAVIIGPTFMEETRAFCALLDSVKIPYVFVDSYFDGPAPLATFSSDQVSCGKAVAHLLTGFTRPGSKLAIFESRRSGARLSTNTKMRRDGFIEYLRSCGREKDLIETCYTSTVPSENEEIIKTIVSHHNDLEGIAVLNSRGSSIAEVLDNLGLSGIKLISFDLTMPNVEYLRKGVIQALLCQHPFTQGYKAIQTLMHYLIQGSLPETVNNDLPIDIILKETVDLYQE